VPIRFDDPLRSLQSPFTSHTLIVRPPSTNCDPRHTLRSAWRVLATRPKAWAGRGPNGGLLPAKSALVTGFLLCH
jgi:hypothetical protein